MSEASDMLDDLLDDAMSGGCGESCPCCGSATPYGYCKVCGEADNQ